MPTHDESCEKERRGSFQSFLAAFYCTVGRTLCARSCLNADADRARALLAKDASLSDELGDQRAELLNLAAKADKRDAVRLMVDLHFDLNEVKRTAPLHLAAGGGHLDMVKLLLELGCGPTVTR